MIYVIKFKNNFLNYNQIKEVIIMYQDNDGPNIILEYPYNDMYEYKTFLERVDLDKQREEDIKNGKGFIISAPKGIKKDIKLQDGIFSSRFGSNLMSEADSFNGRFSCQCGRKRGPINHGEICSVCNTRVRYIEDDVSIKGYLVLKDPYWIIHPNLYRTLEGFIGSVRLNKIIEPEVNIDSNGMVINSESKKKDEPFKGIGIIEFKNRFDEIMNFYLNKFPGKKEFYDDIMSNKNIVFTHTISVYSSLLRPSRLDNGSLRYEACNEQFQMLSRLVYEVNNDKLRINRKIKEKYQLLYDIQCQLNTVYIELKDILAKKKGDIRSSVGGRYSFTERSVIRQNVDLMANQIRLPFHGLCELLQQVIINILVKTTNCTYAEAYKKWYKAQITGNDKTVYDIIDGLIKDSPGGLPFIINRNPTISYGGILAVRCIGINMDYTMSISLLVLKLLAADFDGDTLNILFLLNQDFIKAAEERLSPRQMFISRNDGKCNSDMIHSRDVIINANSLKNLYEYTQEEIDQIKLLQSLD